MRSTRLLPAALLALTVSAAPVGAYGAGLWHMFHTRAKTTELTNTRITSIESKDTRITVQLSNKSGLVQQVKVADRRYTLMPNGALSITAPEGTEVFAVDNGFKHRAGDRLCSLTPKMNLETVVIH
jgi:hypothetical protein